MSEVIAQEVGPARPVVVISGPTFAVEVARQLPTAILAASSDAGATELVQAEFKSPCFRLYGSSDVIGVEIGGAMKNVVDNISQLAAEDRAAIASYIKSLPPVEGPKHP